MAGVISGAFVLVNSVCLARAEVDFPKRPIRLIVPFGAGGSSDVISRALADRLSDLLGRAFVVENKPGAAGSLGIDAVARSEPDGSTFGLGATTTLAINPAVHSRLPYNPTTDIKPVALFAFVSNVLIVNANQHVKGLSDFVKQSNASAGTFNYGSGGVGQTFHLLGELLKSETGADLTHIPYKSDTEILQELLGGRIQATFTTLIAAAPMIKAGAVTALGIVSPKRSPILPDVPTFAELGYPSLQFSSWFGIIAPKGTPDPLIAQLSVAIEKALATPELKEVMARFGVDATYMGPAEFERFIESESAKWGAVAKKEGIRID